MYHTLIKIKYLSCVFIPTCNPALFLSMMCEIEIIKILNSMQLADVYI